ncbi:hypothetical protein [Burkholderia vietnamiensis]|uniref:hypothetical protein n=1 Tax=Burkholderia vietnamiensis TaxID=60552 RepID=UPI0015945548|nr:hypothetical protein [Burkholderia vietnamiensis]
MKKAILIALVPLVACTGMESLRTGWEQMRGKPVDVAIEKLGVPQSERTIAGHHVYTWTTSHTVPLYDQTVGVTTGSANLPAGQAMYSSLTTTGGFTPTNLSCKIDIEVDRDNLMRKLYYDGSIGGCAAFADRLSSK